MTIAELCGEIYRSRRETPRAIPRDVLSAYFASIEAAYEKLGIHPGGINSSSERPAVLEGDDMLQVDLTQNLIKAYKVGRYIGRSSGGSISLVEGAVAVVERRFDNSSGAVSPAIDGVPFEMYIGSSTLQLVTEFVKESIAGGTLQRAAPLLLPTAHIVQVGGLK